MQQPKFIISGGGTGGHIFPAIAIANALKAKLPNAQFLFVGALGKMEMEKVPQAGYTIEGLWISGFQRKLSLQNLTFPFKVISSLVKARKIVKKFKPNVVIGTGGFASGPTLKAAANLGIPILIQEQNSYAGVTNKLLAKQASKICVAFDGMEKFFPVSKIVVTGNPVRKDVIDIDGKREEALAFFGLSPNRPTLLIIGGSLGSVSINKAIKSGLNKLVENNIQVIWQTGKLSFDEMSHESQAYADNGIKVFEFIKRMDLAYAASHVVVSRAGAIAVSELCLTKKPSILVPFPFAAEDHQTKNAKALTKHQAAIMVKDADAHINLVNEAISLLLNINLQNNLATAISLLAKPKADEIIANHVIELMK